MLRTSPRALLIFTRNPVPGKCKTRLAATVGEKAALEIYLFLLRHTASVCAALKGVDKLVYFSEPPANDAIWDPETFYHRVQEGDDLGLRMQRAFENAFKSGYTEVIIIGSDLYDLSTSDLREAFDRFSGSEVVLGPAADGGYYLLGLKRIIPGIFENKAWGTGSVLEDTRADLKDTPTAMLPLRNDVDRFEDIEGNPVFEHFLKNTND